MSERGVWIAQRGGQQPLQPRWGKRLCPKRGMRVSGSGARPLAWAKRLWCWVGSGQTEFGKASQLYTLGKQERGGFGPDPLFHLWGSNFLFQTVV